MLELDHLIKELWILVDIQKGKEIIKKEHSMLKKDALCAIIFFTFSLCYVKKEAVIKTLYNLTKIFIIKLNQYIVSDSEIINHKKNPQN